MAKAAMARIESAASLKKRASRIEGNPGPPVSQAPRSYDPAVPESAPGRTLTVLRFIVGGGTWLAPRSMGRLFGLDIDANPQAAYVGRLFAVRDAVLGVGLVATTGD